MERLRLILIMSDHLFDNGSFTAGDIKVFIGMAEKSLGAQPGTPGHIHELIHWQEASMKNSSSGSRKFCSSGRERCSSPSAAVFPVSAFCTS